MDDETRPPLFTLGIALTSLRALLYAGLAGLIGGAACVALAIGSAAEHGEDAVALLVVAIVGAFLVTCYVVFQLLVVTLCIGAWMGSRTFVWVLMVASGIGIGLPAPGLLKTPIAVVTLIGCIQTLDNRRDDSLEDSPGETGIPG